ncbi:unnamed protein product [Dicrocoelium dendriticum]|nr:unnamed protein product [Dicrocoelium dendriticum]
MLHPSGSPCIPWNTLTSIRTRQLDYFLLVCFLIVINVVRIPAPPPPVIPNWNPRRTDDQRNRRNHRIGYRPGPLWS